MRAHFIHRKHLCLVFECLSSNLYELIKQNGFRGLSIQLVKVFATQLLDTMEVLHEARLIHCDLKPENILLKRCVRAPAFVPPPPNPSRARRRADPLPPSRPRLPACNRPRSR